MDNKKYYTTVAFVAIITIAAVVAIFYWAINSTQNSTTQTGETIDNSNRLMTPAEQLTSIKRQAKIVILPSISQTTISLEDLPKSLNDFILADAEQIKISSVEYEDRSSGFVIDYTVAKSVNASYRPLVPLPDSSRKSLLAMRSDETALINIEDNFYFVSIEFILIGKDQTAVKASIIKK